MTAKRVRLALLGLVISRVAFVATSIADDIVDHFMTPADLYHRARPILMGISLTWFLVEFLALAGLMALPRVLTPAVASVSVGLFAMSGAIGARAVYQLVTSTAEPHPGFWLHGGGVLLSHLYLLLLLWTLVRAAEALGASFPSALTSVLFASVCARALLFVAKASTEFRYDSRIVSSLWLPTLGSVLSYVADIGFAASAVWLWRRAAATT